MESQGSEAMRALVLAAMTLPWGSVVVPQSDLQRSGVWVRGSLQLRGAAVRWRARLWVAAGTSAGVEAQPGGEQLQPQSAEGGLLVAKSSGRRERMEPPGPEGRVGRRRRLAVGDCSRW